MNQTTNFVMTSGYISGLTQTDGSFFCNIILSTKHRFGLQFRPKFTITADLDSKHVLENIKSFLKCGVITINRKNHTAELQVDKLEDLANIIIPHFNNYPVFCAKLHAFNLFKLIVYYLTNKDKRTIEGRRELLKLALSMNLSSNRTEDRINLLYSLLKIENEKDKELIPNTNLTIDSSISDDFVAGVIDGDGSFFISFQKDGNIKPGFNITNDIASKPLLESIKQNNLSNIGSINPGTKGEIVLAVTGLTQINQILIPFMDKNPLLSERALHYDKFKTVNQLLVNNKVISLDTKLKIVDLTYDMNKKGKHRNLSKLDYINLLIKIHN